VKTPNYGRGLAIIVAAIVVGVPLAFFLLLAVPCVMWGGCP
jgi:hypothetical protein